MASAGVLLGLRLAARMLQCRIPNGLLGHGAYKQSRKLELSTAKILTIVNGMKRYNDSQPK